MDIADVPGTAIDLRKWAMKFTAEITLLPRSAPARIGPDTVAEIARTAEAVGFDALAFNEHPAPSKKWLDSDGHDAFDPFVALGFCAAVTHQVRLLAYTVVAPYRNPLLLAKSVASVDVLSAGRLVLGLGVGYLRSEFAALGMEFDDRNELYDTAIEVLQQLWADDDSALAMKTDAFTSVQQVSKPPPVQRPHPPLWIGGNSPKARQRAARFGAGWAPLMVPAAAAATTRTVPITSTHELRTAIEDLYQRCELVARDPSTIEIQLQCAESFIAADRPVDAGPHLDLLGELTSIGVTQFVVHLRIGDGAPLPDVLERYSADVIRQL